MKSTHEHDLQMATPNTHIIGASIEKPRCSVKAAAARIERSATTVYRLRRKLGPVRFVVSGRRIYVETDSLDEYIARRGSTEAACDARPTAQASTEPDTQGPISANIVCESPVAEPEHAQPTPLRSETTCGQRDLMIPERRYYPLIFFYLA